MSDISPHGWEKVKLSDICHVELGQSPPSSSYNEVGDGLPFFQGKAEFTKLFPIARKWCAFPRKIAHEKDILLSVRAPVGPTNLASAQCCIGRGLAALSPYCGVENRFVLYALRLFQNNLDRLGTGTTFKAVSGGVVRKFPCLLAPTNEQRRIVAKIEELFSELDAGVAALERVKANLKRYRASVLKSAVEGNLTEQWRAEHPDVEPASELLKRILAARRKKWEGEQLAKYEANGKKPPENWKEKYKDPSSTDTSNLPELPYGWCWATVDLLGDTITGSTPSKNHPEYFGGKIPFVKPKDLNAGYYVKTAFDTLTKAGSTKARLLPTRTILVTCIGATIGKTGFSRMVCATNQQINAFIPCKDFVCPEWIYWSFVSHLGQTQIKSKASATTLPILNKGKFNQLAFPLCPLEEQKEIIKEIEIKFSIANQIGTELEINLLRSVRLRQAILKRAFEGKLVPQDPNDEPTGILLERIKADREKAEKENQQLKTKLRRKRINHVN